MVRDKSWKNITSNLWEPWLSCSEHRPSHSACRNTHSVGCDKAHAGFGLNKFFFFHYLLYIVRHAIYPSFQRLFK